MKEIELKPCPFCGAEAYIADTWDTTKYVQCTICGCKTLYLKSELEAAELWNRRTAPKTKPNTKKKHTKF